METKLTILDSNGNMLHETAEEGTQLEFLHKALITLGADIQALGKHEGRTYLISVQRIVDTTQLPLFDKKDIEEINKDGK